MIVFSLYKDCSSTYASLDLFVHPRANIIVQHYRPFWLYFIAFAVVIAGLITYFWSSTRKPPYFSLIFIHLFRDILAEEQGFLDPQAPHYVHRKRGGPILPDDAQEV